jgi:hypothetical protein
MLNLFFLKATTKYNKDGSVNRIIEASNGDFAVDLFPYKIKNRELFYDRDHPVNISPESFEYEIYWNSKLKNYLEGRWVDDEGTWVFHAAEIRLLYKLHSNRR